MPEVLPAINCEPGDTMGVERKLRTAEAFADWVHLDIADGVFTMGKSWNDPEAWRIMHPQVKVELHLMAEHPEEHLEPWFAAGMNRLIFHYEAFPHTKDNPERLRARAIERILKQCSEKRVEVMFAINPETRLDHVAHHLSRFSAFQIFSQAHPGPSGQPFLESVLPKIRSLRERFPNARIEVDGGMILKTAEQAVKAGADTIVAGSYIFNAPNPEAAYRALREL